jgi:hypothetical protein
VFDPSGANPLASNPGVGLLDGATLTANAKTAASNGDLVAAAEWWSLAAEKGDPEGQAGWGDALATGKGVKINDDLAFSWFEKSANQGNAWGEAWEGDYYDHGYGSTPHDPVRARYWYQKAADGGNESAQTWLSKNSG